MANVWQKYEIELIGEGRYDNPYADVEVWADVQGPDFHKRCYGFWDGGSCWRIRIMAAAPGHWSWTTGASVSDHGLRGRTGSFNAHPPSRQQIEQNPNHRGLVRASANGHALDYADGTPFFLVGDTWWSASTFRWPWRGNGSVRRIGPGMSFQDAVQFRRQQGYNCIAMIAAFPAWANDGLPYELLTDDGVCIRHAWPTPGTDTAMDMHDESGNRPFPMRQNVPGPAAVFPDTGRINPAYFQHLDRKIDYLNANGMIAFVEAIRRDVGQAWRAYGDWPDGYIRYAQYVFRRYQANNVILSPIHFDWNVHTIAPSLWNEAANRMIDLYGPPPFGTLVSANVNGSTLRTFGHRDQARWLTCHQSGNQREHFYYEYLSEIFNEPAPLPAFNGEPYYDGWPIRGAEGGSDESARLCRSGMYGSVLSGGLAGHIHGAQSLWDGQVEPASPHPTWQAIRWPAAAQMKHLATFMLSEDSRYRDLVPNPSLLSPHKSGPDMGYNGWAYCARTEDASLFMLYFERDCPNATLSGCTPNAHYHVLRFDPRAGQWMLSGDLKSDSAGVVHLPSHPHDQDWAMKLTRSRR